MGKWQRLGLSSWVSPSCFPPWMLNGRGSQAGGRGPDCPSPAGHCGSAPALHPRATSDKSPGLPIGRAMLQPLRAAEGIPAPTDLR